MGLGQQHPSLCLTKTTQGTSQTMAKKASPAHLGGPQLTIPPTRALPDLWPDSVKCERRNGS